MACRSEIENSSTFVKYYGGAYDNLFGDVIAMPDNSFVLVGTTQSFQAGIVDTTRIKPYDVLLIRTDAQGNVVWQKNLGFTGTSEKGTVIKITKQGNFIIAATVFEAGSTPPKYYMPILSEGRFYAQIWVTQVDNNGNILWQTILGDSSKVACQVVDIIQSYNGDFIVLGNIDSLKNDVFAQDMYVARLDLDGQLLWQKKYGNDGFRHDFSSIVREVPDSDGEMIWLGSVQASANDNQNYDIRLVKADKFGNLIWDYVYPQPPHREFPTALLSFANGYRVVAWSERNKIANSQILEISRQGELMAIHDVEFNGFLKAGEAVSTSENSFVLVGQHFLGNIDALTQGFSIAECLGNGKLIFKESFGGELNIAENQILPLSLVALRDGTFAIGGTLRFGQNKMLFLVKTNRWGKI